MPREMMTTPVAEPKEDSGVHITVTLATPTRRRKAGNQEGPGGKAGPVSRPRIPRITRLMALAIKFQGMLDCGVVRDYADLARLGYVTRARVTQIMNLLMLAPDIQEQLLSSERLSFGVRERAMRGICAQVQWTMQRHRWKALLAEEAQHLAPSLRDNNRLPTIHLRRRPDGCC